MERRRMGQGRPPLATWMVAGLLGLAMLVGAAPAEGQDARAPAAGERSTEEMETLTRVYLALSEIRDDLHRELAETHQIGVRQEIRDRAERRRFEALDRYGVSEEAYDGFIFEVSADPEVRGSFEATLLRLRGSPDPETR